MPMGREGLVVKIERRKPRRPGAPRRFQKIGEIGLAEAEGAERGLDRGPRVVRTAANL